MAQRILIVSDARSDQPLHNALAARGFKVATESDTARAFAQLAESFFDLLIIDIIDADAAIGLLKKMRSYARLRDTLVLVTAEWGTGQPTLALSNGADAFEPKPIDAPRLIEAVENLLRPRMVMTAKASGNGIHDTDK